MFIFLENQKTNDDAQIDDNDAEKSANSKRKSKRVRFTENS